MDRLNFGQQRKLGLKVGAWGINMLTSLPVLALDGEILKMTAAVDEIMDDVLARALVNNPLLSPLTTPPEPWTQVHKGGLPADHWAKEGVPLIRERHPSIEAAARKAIGMRRMQPVLDAINVLQRVAFTINKPVLDFDDPHWHALDGAAAKHLVMLWLIASEDESKQGLFPDVPTLAFRLRITEKAVRHLINTLSRWLECDDIKLISPRYQLGPPETETETETEIEGEAEKKTGKILFPDAWAISDSHFELGNKLGLTKEEIEEAANEMRSWSLGNGERRANWDFVFNNWLRRNAKRKSNGFGRPRAFQDDSRSASKGRRQTYRKS